MTEPSNMDMMMVGIYPIDDDRIPSYVRGAAKRRQKLHITHVAVGAGYQMLTHDEAIETYRNTLDLAYRNMRDIAAI